MILKSKKDSSGNLKLIMQTNFRIVTHLIDTIGKYHIDNNVLKRKTALTRKNITKYW